MPPFRSHSGALQRRLEEHSLTLAESAPIQEERRVGRALLESAFPQADRRSRSKLDAIAEEITLNALIGVVDGRLGEDLPRVIMRPPRTLGGRHVPGNRGLHDNPDTFYRLIPLDDRSDFVLEGEAPTSPATIFELSGLTAGWQTLGNLTREDLGIAPGSRFRVHFGPEPGPDCDHFVPLPADAEMLLLRETLADWQEQRPCALRIENRIDRGGERTTDDDATVERARARVAKWFSEAVRLTEAPLSRPANAFPTPILSGEHGKLVTMAYSIGHYDVKPGQALLFDVDPGEAAYVGVPITNLYGTTNDNLARGASLNDRQAEREPDGRFTCVLSHEDPGIANWLDPDGFERGFVFVRWAGLDPEKPPVRAPAIETRLIELAELRDHLPPRTGTIDPEARREQRRVREAQHAFRFEEIQDE
ncbi:MAG: hypothetical protein NXI30_06165 [bacterium]|nr:hypothetical protein [bacterium]